MWSCTRKNFSGEVLKITYKYKQSSPKLKVKETIHFVEQEDIDEICW